MPQKPASPYEIRFHGYEATRSQWVPSQIEECHQLCRGSEIKIVSWDIDFSSPDLKARTAAILGHLQDECGDMPIKLTIIMLQEVCQDSLDTLLQSPWVQRHFNISNIEAPKSIHSEIAGNSFIMRSVEWRATTYFSLMLISVDMPIAHGFRVPLATILGRDVLAADIRVGGSNEPRKQKDVVRMCTTHLESLYGGRAYRPGQLALIASLCKGDPSMECNVVAGLVAGDTNAIDRTEHEYPKADDVQLNDAWENGPQQAIPVLKRFERDCTNGLAKGSTWGYQRASGKRDGKRMDKILYTGSFDLVPLHRGEQLTRGMRRLGVGSKTIVEAIAIEDDSVTRTRSGKIVIKKKTRYHRVESVEAWNKVGGWSRDGVRVRTDAWISDHYGILAKLKIL